MKKLLSIILTILMIVTIIPMVFAADTEPSAEAMEYPVWVAGKRVIGANIDDVLDDGTVSYDPETNTLTLKGAVLSGTNDGIRSNENLIISGTGSIIGNHGIYMESGDLTIDGDVELINATGYYGIFANDGSITITENGRVGAVNAVQSIWAKGDIVIDGTVGKVTATISSGIFTSDGNITIGGEIGDIDAAGDYGIRAANGTVTFSAGSEVGNITSNTNAVSAKNINIIGKVGNLTAANGIHATDTVSIAGTVGDITATGNGIYAKNNITINGNVGTVFGNNCGIVSETGNIAISGTTGVVSSESYAAINANGTISVSNTSVVSEGKGVSSTVETTDNGGILAVNGNDVKVYGDFNLDKCIGTEHTFENLALISGAKLTIPSDETLEVEISLNNDGTIDNQGTLKLPAGAARTRISGGILYIGEQGFLWNDEYNAYRCLDDAHVDSDGDYLCDNGCGHEFEKPVDPTPDTPDTPDEPAEDTCDRCGLVHTNIFQKLICLLMDLMNRVLDMLIGIFI